MDRLTSCSRDGESAPTERCASVQEDLNLLQKAVIVSEGIGTVRRNVVKTPKMLRSDLLCAFVKRFVTYISNG